MPVSNDVDPLGAPLPDELDEEPGLTEVEIGIGDLYVRVADEDADLDEVREQFDDVFAQAVDAYVDNRDGGAFRY